MAPKEKALTNNQSLIRTCVLQELEESTNYSDQSSYFEFFSAEQILKNNNLSDSEIETGIVDGGLDGGCDSIYVF